MHQLGCLRWFLLPFLFGSYVHEKKAYQGQRVNLNSTPSSICNRKRKRYRARNRGQDEEKGCRYGLAEISKISKSIRKCGGSELRASVT
ncbi:uncharacterized protein M421DRAFT_425598 [Didymella exigua CBS 183.55]|uniref:Secreted protein n=1 Tax=Didymella exigua CBS 183.55 TaxID=1150837 RepID=A0A6A5R7U8_9PLEO|nr:uncharacterized protein M421DRAFT_425598 [Didymella exigua CBS 183.55]KAF1923713.1 hypothetical protein M421DRAFT_425598 [Didymella exigua CBS 183.55]